MIPSCLLIQPLAMRYGSIILWRKDEPYSNLVPYPDAANRLVFELQRVPQGA